ncbi:MAG: hypothetical protein AVDCRST_MAG88-831, partial [uncultured Thermomicrobiales bacterium]
CQGPSRSPGRAEGSRGARGSEGADDGGYKGNWTPPRPSRRARAPGRAPATGTTAPGS